MEKKRFLFFGIALMLFCYMLVSCISEDNHRGNLVRFISEPVIVKTDNSKAVIRTQYGDILAPRLESAASGDYYLLDFWMDLSVRPYTACKIQGKKIGADTATIVTNGIEDDYVSSFFDVKIYVRDPNANFLKDSYDDSRKIPKFICLDSVFFIKPIFEDHNQTYEIELLAPADSVDSESGIPSLYLRAKPSVKDHSRSAYALNLSELIKQPQYEGKNEIQFHLKFKSGEEKSSGKDIYKNYKRNPVSIQFSKTLTFLPD